MKNHVTIVPSDKIILVDGLPLRFEFEAPANLHAIQWHEGSGHMEWTDDLNHHIKGEALYQEDVAPFVALWEAERARLDAEAAEAEAARLAEFNSTENRAARVRAERNSRITATDYLMLPDYPLAEKQKNDLAIYRTELRNITNIEGFPWEGPDSAPWPTLPI